MLRFLYFVVGGLQHWPPAFGEGRHSWSLPICRGAGLLNRISIVILESIPVCQFISIGCILFLFLTDVKLLAWQDSVLHLEIYFHITLKAQIILLPRQRYIHLLSIHIFIIFQHLYKLFLSVGLRIVILPTPERDANNLSSGIDEAGPVNSAFFVIKHHIKRIFLSLLITSRIFLTHRHLFLEHLHCLLFLSHPSILL
jgi:hypothetical protein